MSGRGGGRAPWLLPMLGAIGMAALLALYLVVLVGRAFVFIGTGEPVAIGMGIALIVLPAVGVWALGRELLFGVRAARLTGRLDREGGLPVDDLTKRTSGRPLRESADAAFDLARSEAEEAPEDWRSWFRLGLAYDAAGDRRRARRAVRHAIALDRAH